MKITKKKLYSGRYTVIIEMEEMEELIFDIVKEDNNTWTVRTFENGEPSKYKGLWDIKTLKEAMEELKNTVDFQYNYK